MAGEYLALVLSPPPRLSVAPLGATPSPPLGSCSCVGMVGGWFSPPPPTLFCPPLPVIGTLVGLPGFCLPRGPCLIWGLRCPLTTRALLRFVGSSHPAMTQPHPPPPVGVEFSLDNSTPPPSPWRVESSGDNSTPPSTPWRTLLEFFFHPEGLTPPSSHSTLWGLGVTLEALRPPEFPSTPQG